MAELIIANDEQILAVLKTTQGLTLYPGGVPVEKDRRAVRSGDPISINITSNLARVAMISELSATSAMGAASLIKRLCAGKFSSLWLSSINLFRETFTASHWLWIA